MSEMNKGGFYWDGFSEEEYNRVRLNYKGHEEDGDEFDGVIECSYEGNVRIGDLCFDIQSRYDPEGNQVLSFALFVGGVDDGYAWAEREVNGEKEEYPYDEVDIGYFDSYWIEKDYEAFKEYAEILFTRAVEVANQFYKLTDLEEKMKNPLNIWYGGSLCVI